ncbi:hypothetical protein Gohar_027663, partial [Gossypium harknessii]|nr:hypothetical protein [Gossypium harknessii]
MLNTLKNLVGSVDSEVEDCISWILDSVGEFTVRKLSQLLAFDGMGAIDFPFGRIWKLNVPPKVWNFSVDVVSCWTMWLVWNDKVFERTSTNLDIMLFHSKIRALMWARVVHEECQFLEGDWWPWLVKCRSSLNMKNMNVSYWKPPPTEWMKFNVAGVVLEEVAGCAGVLREEKGVACALFL